MSGLCTLSRPILRVERVDVFHVLHFRDGQNDTNNFNSSNSRAANRERIVEHDIVLLSYQSKKAIVKTQPADQAGNGMDLEDGEIASTAAIQSKPETEPEGDLTCSILGKVSSEEEIEVLAHL